MNELISPKYQMKLVNKVEEAIWKEFGSYKNVQNYIVKWHIHEYNWENFNIIYKDENNIDLNSTLHSMVGDILLKIAIDLGVDTPDFIPSIPTFKNKLKSNYKTAYDTFMKGFKQIETDPSLAVGLANSALESIIKEILKDERIESNMKGKETLYDLTKIVVKEFNLIDSIQTREIRTISSSLLAMNQAIETLRSEKTNFHGKTNEDFIINDSLYAYFIVNSVATIGLFLIEFYKNKYPKPSSPIDLDTLPF